MCLICITRDSLLTQPTNNMSESRPRCMHWRPPLIAARGPAWRPCPFSVGDAGSSVESAWESWARLIVQLERHCFVVVEVMWHGIIR